MLTTVLRLLARATPLFSLFLLLGACTPASVPTSLTPSPSPPATEVAAPLDLTDAYRLDDAAARRAAVLDATGHFLLQPDTLNMDDGEASWALTEAAFLSGALHLSDPGFVRRGDGAAVLGLPDGLGLFLYDLTAAARPPLEISRWTVGLSGLEVTWGAGDAGVGEAGIAYTTLGADDVSRVHFALVTQEPVSWRLAWSGDEAPDWWFNTAGSVLTVAPDLSRLTVTGAATYTTDVFYELADAPRRTFRVDWVREENRYRLSPLMESYPSRMAWLQAVAEPSPYATLVAFIERLQTADEFSAAQLAADESLLDTAFELGLYRNDRRYQVVQSEGDALAFRDLEGTYRARFTPPTEEGGDWLISEIMLETEE